MDRSGAVKHPIEITPDVADTIARYTDVYLDMVEGDHLSVVDREHLRSYSSEVLLGILRANPDVFDFVGRMAAVKARKVGK